LTRAPLVSDEPLDLDKKGRTAARFSSVFECDRHKLLLARPLFKDVRRGGTSN